MEEQIDRGRWTDRDTERGRDGGGETDRDTGRETDRDTARQRDGESSVSEQINVRSMKPQRTSHNHTISTLMHSSRLPRQLHHTLSPDTHTHYTHI